MQNIQMVDLKNQYHQIKPKIDKAILDCLENTTFINGPAVKEFQQSLETYLGVKHVIPCANGTDALQISMMALGLKRGDEVIVPAFTYVATAEVIALLGLKPVMVDVNFESFNIDVNQVKKAITSKTKAIVPVHLFGQSADMEAIMEIATEHGLLVIEDNAQAIGADFQFKNGGKTKTGTIGHIGCTSFFPSKNLGCYGDGGAIFTNDSLLAEKLKVIANHGQNKLYQHGLIGVNSRLDSIQAAILNCKLPLLDKYNEARSNVANFYDASFSSIKGLEIPQRVINSNHVFHQYTLKVDTQKRNSLKEYLAQNGVPSMVYYPIPLYKQEAYKKWFKGQPLAITEKLCQSVLSLPIHTEMNDEILSKITSTVLAFFQNK
jgi:UDP-2-acetamido-2-deoxy-ribo-hexuluronate aminotransferase